MRLLIRFWRWLRTPRPDVDRAWLADHERREGGRGIEQSTSKWPWPADKRW